MIDYAGREQSIIGMLHLVMLNTGEISAVQKYTDQLSEQQFFSKAGRIGFDRLKRFVNSGQEFDLFMLKDAVNSDPRCNGEPIGQIVMESCHSTASAVSLSTAIKQQRRHASRVSALNYVESLHQQLTNDEDVTKIAGQAASFFEGVAGNLNDNKQRSYHVTEVAHDYIRQLEYDMQNPEEAGGLPTGFNGFDSLLGMRKVQPGTLMVIGARPGMGKTALMTYIMVTQAQHVKEKAFIAYSLEMPRVSLYERVVKDQTGYSYEETLNGDDTVFSMVTQLTANLKDTQLYMNDSANMAIEDIEADAREQAKERNIGAIFVDYLTIMQLPKKDRHDLSIGEITRRLKKLSVELGCSIVLLAQLNRAIDDPSRRNKRPVLKDLRDSGSIEQDADYIVFPYRDIYYDEQSIAQEYCEIILAKNRHGRQGTAYARFVNGRFLDCDQDQAATKCQAAENDKNTPAQKPRDMI